MRSLRRRVKGKRVLLVRAKVARDVIPRELRRAGAHVDVVEAYETIVPESSRTRLQAALKNPRRRPHIVTFTSSSTVKNFVELLGARGERKGLNGILTASIGPVTSSTLRSSGFSVDIAAKEVHHSGTRRGYRRWGVSARHYSREGTTAIGRHHVRQQKVGYAFVGIDLVLYPCESVAFIFINLVVDCSAAFS